MEQLSNGLTLFFSLLVEAIPFLLIGVAFSSLLLFFVDERTLIKLLPKTPLLGAIAGSLMGVFFPVCECGNVPVARRLIVQGAPSSVAVGFLLAAPTINPVVFWATWVAFRDQPEIVFLRVLFTLFIAVIIAWIFSRQIDMRPILQSAVARQMPKARRVAAPSNPLLRSGTFLLQTDGSTLQLDDPTAILTEKPEVPLAIKLQLVIDNMVQELKELGAVLILGSAIAAFVQVAIPRDWILALGQNFITSILAMMLLAAVVSICSTVDSFFALSFASTFTTGAQLAFLVFGPMIDLKNIGLLMTLFKPRAIIYIFMLAAQLCFILTLFMNLYVS
ncbi:permease [Leptolyngbyaceae cyanobacterium CCMR0082]|uniref:Permease n=2 Tax=Adonisia turfae TaxID=2950184 RepID=A0A6M0S9N0_9CYAN|nr:permease [Adonisia turfae]MDV3347593.1 permease [Leptothoe sp. LEGE 181152]NEZ57368.1 permease [Adonisia turfae CCMR0081]NEZ64452.1 permease [Adonisia turfae CCMR0082]